MVRQGDVYWAALREPVGSEPGYPRPCVVVQNNVLNRSRLRTVALCAVTTNLKRAQAPSNVLLEPGEGGLTEQSVVVVSQLLTVDKDRLGEKVGTLPAERVREIWSGLREILEPRGSP